MEFSPTDPAWNRCKTKRRRNWYVYMSIFIYMMSSRHSERHACMYMSMQSRCYSICSPKFVLQVMGIGNFSKGSLHMVPNLLNTCTPQIHRWTRDYLSIYWVSVDLSSVFIEHWHCLPEAMSSSPDWDYNLMWVTWFIRLSSNFKSIYKILNACIFIILSLD